MKFLKDIGISAIVCMLAIVVLEILPIPTWCYDWKACFVVIPIFLTSKFFAVINERDKNMLARIEWEFLMFLAISFTFDIFRNSEYTALGVLIVSDLTLWISLWAYKRYGKKILDRKE